MLAALAAGPDGMALARLSDAGNPLGDPWPVGQPHELAAIERDEAPRWVWSSTAELYPVLLRAGVSVARCHDIAATERILLARAGIFDAPVGAAAVSARAAGRPAPVDPADTPGGGIPALFGAEGSAARPAADVLADVAAAYRDQLERVETSACGADVTDTGIAVHPGALRLLIAAESASMLAAAEMTHTGMPWDATVHERILAEILGPRPAPGQHPAKMAQLAREIESAFGFRVNPDSPVDLRQAFRRSGFDVDSTRSWVLRELDHPAVGPLLAYKDLLRLYSANGWNWLHEWVRDGRLVSEFAPGAVVSGRWATRGGGALQIPYVIRPAAKAQPGRVLVVADAAQLEPRVLAAISNDLSLQRVSAGEDLYTSLAAAGFGGDRSHAKVAMLGAMYGQTSGEAGRLLATLRRRYPDAVGYVEAAAVVGERGRIVRSVLGRACPPPASSWLAVGDALASDGPAGPDGPDSPAGRAGGGTAERRARQIAAARGRFTRNFVVQASAADWAAVWLSAMRQSVRAVPGAELVFFQHDELVMHVPAGAAEEVAGLAVTAAARARDLVFPGSAVSIPVRPVVVSCYADAK